MRRILVTVAATAFALPMLAGTASAFELKEGGSKSQGNPNAVCSSQITQNGQAVKMQAQADDEQNGRGDTARANIAGGC